MKFRSELISNILNNESDMIGKTLGSIGKDEKVIIAQGYGVDEKIPLRFLAYAVPVLRLASQMSKATQVEFYFAGNGVSRANGTDYSSNVAYMIKLLNAYVDLNYPDLKGQVKILNDSVDENTMVEESIEVLMPYATNLADTHAPFASFVAKRGGQNAIRYMVEHLFYMRDPIMLPNQNDAPILVPGMSQEHNHLIMVGGPSEKIFWKFRKEMVSHFGSHARWNSHQFFTPVGDPPAYHYFEGEPFINGHALPASIDELLSELKEIPNDFGKAKNVIRDYGVLLQDFSLVEKFKSANEVELPVLENGYKRLIQFLSDIE